MTPKRKVTNLARLFGITLKAKPTRIKSNTYELTAFAPEGYEFNSNDCDELTVQYYTDLNENIQTGYEKLFELLKQGIIKSDTNF